MARPTGTPASSWGRSKPTSDTGPPEDAPPPPGRRGRPRQGRPIARHLPRDEEILQIAGEVFFHHGFDGAKLEDIAHEAGIVKGSLYHYFESKEDIYSRLIADIVNLVDYKEPIRNNDPARERLEAMVGRRARMMAYHPVEIGILGRQLVHMDGEVGDWARDYRRRNFEALRNVIRQGQRKGAFRRADADALAAFILGSLTVVPEWYRTDGRIKPEQMIEELTTFLMDGVLAPSVSPGSTRST